MFQQLDFWEKKAHKQIYTSRLWPLNKYGRHYLKNN
jgi:hypothetical protein